MVRDIIDHNKSIFYDNHYSLKPLYYHKLNPIIDELQVEEQLFYKYTYKIEAHVNDAKWCPCIIKLFAYNQYQMKNVLFLHACSIVQAICIVIHCIIIISPVMHFTTMVPAYNEQAACLYRSHVQRLMNRHKYASYYSQ